MVVDEQREYFKMVSAGVSSRVAVKLVAELTVAVESLVGSKRLAEEARVFWDADDISDTWRRRIVVAETRVMEICNSIESIVSYSQSSEE